jgi:Domain of unknown function (DUF4157)/A nuclease family of the HNH/ENDO VII superfamily with conserved AHH
MTYARATRENQGAAESKRRLPSQPPSGVRTDAASQRFDWGGDNNSSGPVKRRWSLSKVSFNAGPQANSTGSSGRTQPQAGEAPPAVYQALRQQGKPLDHNSRRHCEHCFGHDLGEVRIHTGQMADEAASSIHAAAYTVGSDIVFANNRYSPGTLRGRLLLQHELRHVEQQRFARSVETPSLDGSGSLHEFQARSIFAPKVAPLAEQRVQRAPENAEATIGGRAVDEVGRTVFGATTWPFLKAVFEGFVGGLKSDIQAGRGGQAKEHLKKIFFPPWNALKFYGGYLVGLLLGLISPITDLIKGLIGVIKLAASALVWLAKWSPVGVAVSPERQKKILRLQEKFGELAVEFGNSLVEFAKSPKETAKKLSGFLEHLQQLALGKAHELGEKAAHSIFDFLGKEFYDMGESIGEVIGALIAQILLLVFSEAIGNLISKGASMVGKLAEFVAGKAVEVFQWVKGFVSEIGALLRSAVKGALKLFEGLFNKAIEAFDALGSLFVESEALDVGGEKVAAGFGRAGGSKEADVIDLAAERQRRALAAKASAKPVVREQKLAAGAERESTVASYSHEEVTEHIGAETEHRGPGDQLNREDVGKENIRKSRTVRTTEYDPWVGDSELLGKRLGPPPGPGHEAHHIVPANEPRAAALRDFLRKRGWKDINDADNGVWLPRGEAKNLGTSFKHEFTFDPSRARGLTDEYFRRLEEILMSDPKITRSGIRLKLRGIGGYLKNGQLPPKGF